MEEGDVAITMHAIPHSGTRNDGTEARLNMIWRIRARGGIVLRFHSNVNRNRSKPAFNTLTQDSRLCATARSL
jgi:hypothetical protein